MCPATMRPVLAVETFLIAIALTTTLASTANILDLIYRDFGADTSGLENAKLGRDGDDGNVDVDADNNEPPPTDEKTCNCDGRVCMCCVDFNITFIDLGGPGCVKMKYISQTEGVLLNVSYGDNLLRSAVARGPDPAPTCVSMLAQLAAVCARFSTLAAHNDGLRGCLQLEPKLLGDVQTQFNIGCFTMNDDGMRLDEEEPPSVEVASTTTSPEAVNQTQSEAENPLDGLNEEDILAAVNESAQKGLALFQNWLGIRFTGGADNATSHEEGVVAPAQASADAKEISSDMPAIH